MAVIQGFIGPTFQAQSPTVDAERCVNLFLERATAGTPKSDAWFYATPGLGSTVTCGGGPIRGTFSQDGLTIIASGVELYWKDGTTATFLGNIADDVTHTPVTMCSNGQGGEQMLIIASGRGYVLNIITKAFAEIADADFPAGRAVMCQFLDGYGIINIADTAEIQISALEDFTSWDALDVAEKSQTSDLLVGIAVDLDRKVLLLLGSQNTEPWWDSGASFPFEPVPNAIISNGIVSPWAWCLPDEAMLWIGQSTNGARMAYESAGTSARIVSTPAVSYAWSTYSDVSDCVGWQYEYRNHSMCVFVFPTANATWVYDRTEQQWHEWLYWNQSTGEYEEHLARCHAYEDYNGGQHIVGSRVDGTVYVLSGDYLDDNGAMIRRMRRSPHIANENQWTFCSKLQFDLQVGTGLNVATTAAGYNPQAMLRISTNAGRTYGNERWRSLGVQGDYKKRVLWWHVGAWRDGVIEFTHTDPTVVALTGVYGDFQAGIS